MDADRSSIEIKVLLKNLDPTKANIKHKDRLRRLNKFRNYVTTRPPPEFYDDDYGLLLLGSESPAAMEDEDLSNMTLYGMLRAAGCPSTDHKDSLKRSARPAISLLRYLCLDFERTNSTAPLFVGELNGFAQALCALNIPQLRTLRLDIHIGKGDNESGSRGGSKDDACHLMALILARHTDTDYETPKPVNIKDFLPAGETRTEFDNWLNSCDSVSPEVRKMIQDNISAAASGGGGRGRSSGGGAVAATAAVTASSTAKVFDDNDGDDDDDDDVLGVFGSKSSSKGPKRSKSLLVEGGIDGVEIVTGFGGGTKSSGASSSAALTDGKPTQWSQTQMASVTERASIFLEEEVSQSGYGCCVLVCFLL